MGQTVAVQVPDVEARSAAVPWYVWVSVIGVTSAMIDRLIGSFRPEEGALIVVPTFEGKRGNPVLWSARFFQELRAIEGDTGGRHLIGANPEAVVELELGPAVALDIDTPAELAAIGGVLP